MKILLMFHDDWELFGDGSGDINRLMFEPASRILDLCDKYGVKYSFFAEFGQQLAMLGSTNKQQYKYAKKWEEILIDAIKRGHDVQLHFHPQWINAFYNKGEWKLNYEKYAITNLPKNEMLTWLKRGKDYLHSLLSNNNYEVVAFRSGAWIVQPSNVLISVLKEIGIIADVSIIKGMKLRNDNLGINIDYTNAHSNIFPWFPSDMEITNSSDCYDSFFCIPTFSKMTASPMIIKELINNPFSFNYILKRRKYRKATIYKPYFNKYAYTTELTKNIFIKKIIYYDFGNIHYSTINKMIKGLIGYYGNKNIAGMPLILLSHSKSFYSFENFVKLLRSLIDIQDIQFMTTRDVVSLYHYKFLNGELI